MNRTNFSTLNNTVGATYVGAANPTGIRCEPGDSAGLYGGLPGRILQLGARFSF